MVRKKKKNESNVIGAITTPSHFALTLCMADSFLEHYPHGKVFILQVGGTEKLSVQNRPQITVVADYELEIGQYAAMRRRYSDFELCNSLKPFLLRYIFENTDCNKVCYFDSDLFIYDNLEEEIWQKLDDYSVMLTPHLTQVSGEISYHQDLAILRRGVFNGGFVGLRRDENALKFLEWWESRLIFGGFYRLAEGLNCDQGWLDLVANFDINLHINRHPGLNAAFWNLDERKIEFQGDKPFVNGKPLLFFHFSGYSPENPALLSKNSLTITFEKYPDIRRLFDRYGEKLQAVGKEFQDFPVNISSQRSDDEFEFSVTVVIPCYNAAKFLNQAISSVLFQTLKPLEIIAIDDGSTDETPQILNNFGDSIKVIRQANAGVSAARNKGIEAARGEFIAFLDADDYFIDPTKLEEQLKIARQMGSDIVQSGWTVVDPNGRPIVELEDWKIIPQLDLENWFRAQSIFPGALLIRRSALLDVGGFDTDLSFAEDSDLLIRLLSQGYRADWLEKNAVAYRRHENGVTRRFSERIAPEQRMWDKFFAETKLPPQIRRMEDSIRENSYLYLACDCAASGDFQTMKKLLLDSRRYGKYKFGGALILWLNYFKARILSQTGKSLDVLSLISTKEWRELTEIMSGFESDSNSAEIPVVSKRELNRVRNFSKKIIESPSLPKEETDLVFPRKINIPKDFAQDMGNHRSGWKYAIKSLADLHSDDGVHIVEAVENYFVDRKEFAAEDLRNGWFGFFHHPPDMPHFYEPARVPELVLKTAEMQKALKKCYGVFCFSDHQREWLAERIDVPVTRVFHPTETPENTFTIEKFSANPTKRLVQIGHWLRKVHSIYFLPTDLQKTIVRQDFPHIREYFEIEKKAYGLQVDENSVEILPFLQNEEYDQLLSENIVYLELHAAAANNAIVECIVRNTPVLVNPLPAVKEYLGENYPFYFSNRREAAEKSQNLSLIEQTYEYLVHHPIKEKLTAEYFMQSIAESEVYAGLPLTKA